MIGDGLRGVLRSARQVRDLRRGAVGGSFARDAFGATFGRGAVDLQAEDVVELGHRLILGRAPDPALRSALLDDLASGRLTASQAWADLVASPEFAQRVAHQRAVIEATEPPHVDGLIDVADLREAKSIEEHNAAAEGYFASRDRDTVEVMLAKPFSSALETTELLTCFGHMVAGLQVLPGETLLDFGAGSGWTSWNFAQLGCNVICSDVAPSALELARERFERWPISPGRQAPRFLVFDGHRFDLPDASVDKACCFDAFHHLINQSAVMAEFARVLKPGGLVGFDEPGLHHSKAAQAQFEMREFGVVEGDIDLAEIAVMADKAGLEFVAADVLTVRPIWARLEEFTDLVDNRVPDADMIQQFANQIHAKQLFILRKPGGAGPDSRDRAALGARLELLELNAATDAADVRVQIRLNVHNTGAAAWLPLSAPTGAVALGARILHPESWETRIITNRELTLQPGEQAEVNGTFVLPVRLAGHEVSINLVSESVAWFDVCGTPALGVRVSTDSTP